MVRSNDPFWNHVAEMNDGSMTCEFCGHPFAKSTSISRIKWHLSGEKGNGVTICGKVSKEVQEAAFLAMFGGNKRQKSIASSSNANHDPISSCPQEQNNDVDNLARGIGSIPVEVPDMEQGVAEGRTSSLVEAGNHMENIAGERIDGVYNLARDRAMVPTEFQGREQGVGEGRTSASVEAGNQMENTAGEMMCIDRSVTPEGPIADALEVRVDARQVRDKVGRVDLDGSNWNDIATIAQQMDADVENETRGDPIPTSSTKLVGQAFQENMNVIWSWLMDDEVSSVGIYGMGGVGKTTMLQHIHNRLLERPDVSHNVYWVTVSRDFSIHRLQNLIAKCLDIDFANEDDELRRAVKLSKELTKKQKWILILDDLWDSFEPHKVGIPILLKGCKLIVTSRSEKVCQRIYSQHKIKVNPLSEEEAWTLFMEKLGHDIALSPKVKRIAKDVARECAGLPLGIITMAGSMRGVDDLSEWRNTLKKLKESKFKDIEVEVFQLLRFSYDRLDDSALKHCLLYCALFPEDQEIDRWDLIGYLIDEGIIEAMESREAEFDEGHTMLNKLEKVCLLESCKPCDGARAVKMHDLIRDMAIQIQQETSPIMVKAGAQLRELPEAEEWTENLLRVSLMENQIQEIPSSHSPRCPRLSTLLLYGNYKLRFIADSFFERLFGLKVLDLSCTNIETLPDCVSDLVSLNSLLLNNCEMLRHVPSLEKLRELKRLDLYQTALEKMPQGMEYLSNLRYLRLNERCEKEFPSGRRTRLE